MLLKIKQKRFDETEWKDVKTDKINGKSFVSFLQEEFMPTTLAIYQNNKLKCIISNNDDNKEFYMENDILFISSVNAGYLLDGIVGVNVVTNVFKDTGFISLDFKEPVKE